MSVNPSTKHIASKMLDLPEPLRPVIALKEASHPVICVRTGYDLKPDMDHSVVAQYIGGSEELTFDDELLNPHDVVW